jgi:hypothetical protein
MIELRGTRTSVRTTTVLCNPIQPWSASVLGEVEKASARANQKAVGPSEKWVGGPRTTNRRISAVKIHHPLSREQCHFEYSHSDINPLRWFLATPDTVPLGFDGAQSHRFRSALLSVSKCDTFV